MTEQGPTNTNSKLNFYLLRSIVVGALGGLLFGFDTAVIAGTTHSLTAVFNLTPAQLGVTVSSALWGTVIGAIFSGILGQRIGGRNSLLILASCYLVSALGCAFAWNWSALLVFRFIGGLGIGGSSVVGPVYIAEVSPADWRGRMVGCFQINIVIGILVAYLSNYLIGLQSLGISEWRWQFGVAALPACFFLLMLLGNPSSPRWLATKGRFQEAESILRKLGGADPERELAEITGSISTDSVDTAESLFQRQYLRPIFLAVTIAMFNQLAGINAVLYYSNYIFSMAGFDNVSGNLQAVALGTSNLVATFIAMSLIDRLGRKSLLLIGSVGMVICLSGVAGIFFAQQHQNLLIVCLVGFVGFFALSQGAVIWVYLSEIFPTRVRAKGQSLGSSTHWVMNALISGVFPLVAARSQAYPFVLFAGMVALQFFVVLFAFPETRGVTLEQMQRQLGIEY
jgi:SP family arabinose:H+ symporter-like MFS transporter